MFASWTSNDNDDGGAAAAAAAAGDGGDGDAVVVDDDDDDELWLSQVECGDSKNTSQCKRCWGPCRRLLSQGLCKRL